MRWWVPSSRSSVYVTAGAFGRAPRPAPGRRRAPPCSSRGEALWRYAASALLMSTTNRQRLAWLGAAVLLVLHHDFWRERGVELWFGWLPEELAWRLAWMLLTLGYLVWFCAVVWVEDEAA